MQQFPSSRLNYPFSEASRALLPIPFVVLFVQPCFWPCATSPVGSGPGDRCCETTGGSGVRFFWPKGNQRKRAVGQMAWGVPRAVCAMPLFPWEEGLEAWHQISVGLAGQQQEHAGRGNCILHGQCLLISCSWTAQCAFSDFMNHDLMAVAWVQILWKHFCSFNRDFPYLPTSF